MCGDYDTQEDIQMKWDCMHIVYLIYFIMYIIGSGKCDAFLLFADFANIGQCVAWCQADTVYLKKALKWSTLVLTLFVLYLHNLQLKICSASYFTNMLHVLLQWECPQSGKTVIQCS